MDIRYVEDAGELDTLGELLTATDRIALDLEAAGYHRYSDRVCLVQLTMDGRTFLIDPFEVDPAPALRPALEDPSAEVIMHGADFDVRLLRRDLGVGLTGLFDTQIAASLLGIDGLGLSALLESVLGIEVSKKYQKADWAKRPLPEAMLRYAAHDTLHLRALADELRRRLEEAGRTAWAEEEFREQEKVRFDGDESEDPVTRIRAARDLSAREVHRLREALAWRDEIAKSRDRALFRVVGDGGLVEAARSAPRSADELAGVKGMSRSLARDHGEALLERFRNVDELPENELEGYPRMSRGSGNGNGGRPPPEVEDRFRRLKDARNRKAAELRVERGTLLPNATLQRVAEREPAAVHEMVEITGMRRWQADVLGEELLKLM